MNWYRKAQIDVYRGDPTPVNIREFDSSYGTKELGKQLGQSMAEGPGIYFTTQKEEAQGYGKNITQIKLNNANILTKNSKPFTYQQIDKILKKVDKEKLNDAILNWDENYRIGKENLIQSILNNERAIDQLISIWADVFYHQNPNDFMELMTKSGIDGIAIDQPHSTHYIIYNRNLL